MWSTNYSLNFHWLVNWHTKLYINDHIIYGIYRYITYALRSPIDAFSIIIETSLLVTYCDNLYLLFGLKTDLLFFFNLKFEIYSGNGFVCKWNRLENLISYTISNWHLGWQFLIVFSLKFKKKCCKKEDLFRITDV